MFEKKAKKEVMQVRKRNLIYLWIIDNGKQHPPNATECLSPAMSFVGYVYLYSQKTKERTLSLL